MPFKSFRMKKLKEILNYTSIICLAGIPVQHFFAKDIIELWFGIDLLREEIADFAPNMYYYFTFNS